MRFICMTETLMNSQICLHITIFEFDIGKSKYRKITKLVNRPEPAVPVYLEMIVPVRIHEKTTFTSYV